MACIEAPKLFFSEISPSVLSASRFFYSMGILTVPPASERNADLIAVLRAFGSPGHSILDIQRELHQFQKTHCRQNSLSLASAVRGSKRNASDGYSPAEWT